MAFLLAAPAAVDPATRAIDHKEACETLCPELVISAGGTQISVNGFCDTCSGHDCNGPMRPDCCHKLGYGDGDCDSDDDCLPGLFCGHNNCAEFRVSAGWPEESERGWDTTDDCCFAVRDGGLQLIGREYTIFMFLRPRADPGTQPALMDLPLPQFSFVHIHQT